MENASKALIMAGGILIALMTIGALIFMFDSISGVENQKSQNAEIEAVLEFNKQFEEFDTAGLRGSDMITVMNKIINYNRKVRADQEGYNYIEISITFKQNFADISANTTKTLVFNENDNNEETDHGNELYAKYREWFGKTSKEMSTEEAKEQLTEFKRKYFRCTNIGYDNITGRVNSLSFTEIIVK